jgi:hypothetical protein
MPVEPGNRLVRTTAWETLGMNNPDAWRAIEARLRGDGVTGPDVETLRRAAWAERKRLRAAARSEQKASPATEGGGSGPLYPAARRNSITRGSTLSLL